jgi:hypothetical protein
MTMVLLWCALELLLLHHLPLRSAHYYVATCVPFVLLSGWPWMVLARSLPGFSRGAQVASWSIAVIGAAICYRPVVDVIVPKAIANYRAYDWSADQRYFDEAIQWGRIHFGEGPPSVRQAED